jgi:hypothetical protein
MYYFDENLIQQIFNSNEFKGWLLSRRWFGDKSKLSNLAFKIDLIYFKIIAERIFISIIQIHTQSYLKSYFLPLIQYDKIQDILEPKENTRDNIIKLIDNTYSKMVALTVHDKPIEEVISLNLVEAEYCVFFWKNMLFDKKLSETFPNLSMELLLYTEQFEDETNMAKVQNLIEASLYPDRYEYSIEQLGGGNTNNLLFLLKLFNKRKSEVKVITFIIKSYKEFTERVEPRTLYILVKNNFPNAPKIYGTIKINGKETIGLLEDIPNIGNIGDVYWNDLNKLIKFVFETLKKDFSILNIKENISNLIKKNCTESLRVSEQIGLQIKQLHKALILPGDPQYEKVLVNSKKYLNSYTERLTKIILSIEESIAQKSENAFYNSPKIKSILIDVKDIIEKFKTEFKIQSIELQPIHQDLHMQQILYNKDNQHYNFYFIGFEGDPQLNYKERMGKFPIEKDLGSFLRSLSYIKFNAMINFIETNLIDREKFEVPEELLFSVYFRRAAKITQSQLFLEKIVNLVNGWEVRLMNKIFDKSLNLNFPLINLFTIERAMHELDYELLYRPSNMIIPILGLKEIIDKY